MASSRKLTIVGNETDNHLPHSDEFAGVLEQWYSSEVRLQNIFKKLDDAVSGIDSDNIAADDLLKVQIELEREQRDLLVEIARRPAKNVFDVIAKLEIWKSLIMPDGSDPTASQPSDQIVNSVLSDLLSGAANSS